MRFDRVPFAVPPMLFTCLAALSGCNATPTGIEGETIDTVTPAFVQVHSDGGNSLFETEWRLDSATAFAQFTATSKCLSCGVPGRHVARVVSRASADSVFALVHSDAFRALKAHYPSRVVADFPFTTISLVVNARRRTIDGSPPSPASDLQAALAALVPPPPGGP